MLPIIFILIIQNILISSSYGDLKFDDIEQEIRANNDKNYVEYLKSKNSRAKELQSQIAEHKKQREKMQKLHKASVKEHIKLRKTKKDSTKLEEEHENQKLILLEKYKKSRSEYIKNREKQKKETVLQSQVIRSELRKNIHILEESTSKSHRVKKEDRKY